MKCPYCSGSEFKVTDKRNSPDGMRRRRECLNHKCARRFTTYEKVEPMGLFVIKKDGRREPFDREKIENGLIRAFEKRPISKEKIHETVERIENALRKKGNEVKSSFIGNQIMKKIEKLDKVAYVRFASVYNDFNDIKDFKKEIQGLGK